MKKKPLRLITMNNHYYSNFKITTTKKKGTSYTSNLRVEFILNIDRFFIYIYYYVYFFIFFLIK
jgi:hypothetical protein